MSATNEGSPLKFVVSLGGRIVARHEDGTEMSPQEASADGHPCGRRQYGRLAAAHRPRVGAFGRSAPTPNS